MKTQLDETRLHEVNAANLAYALELAEKNAKRFVKKLPAWMDREAFADVALHAVGIAAAEYTADKDATFITFARMKINFFLVDEARKQDPVGRVRRKQISSGKSEEKPSELPAWSLQHYCEMTGETLEEIQADPAHLPEALVLDKLERADFNAQVYAAFSALSEEEAEIVELRFFQSLSRTRVAARLKKSHAYVKEAEERALGKLRAHLLEHAPDIASDFLPAAGLEASP